MDLDITLGCIAIVITVGLLTYFVLRSRQIINRIQQKGPGSARKIAKEINNSK